MNTTQQGNNVRQEYETAWGRYIEKKVTKQQLGRQLARLLGRAMVEDSDFYPTIQNSLQELSRLPVTNAGGTVAMKESRSQLVRLMVAEHNYSVKVDELIYTQKLASWPAEELAELLAAIYDQCGATVRQSDEARQFIIDTLPTSGPHAISNISALQAGDDPGERYPMPGMPPRTPPTSPRQESRSKLVSVLTELDQGQSLVRGNEPINFYAGHYSKGVSDLVTELASVDWLQWPVEEISRMVAAIYDRHGASVKQSEEARRYVMDTLPFLNRPTGSATANTPDSPRDFASVDKSQSTDRNDP
jgi:hypothetical protein